MAGSRERGALQILAVLAGQPCDAAHVRALAGNAAPMDKAADARVSGGGVAKRGPFRCGEEGGLALRGKDRDVKFARPDLERL